MMRDKHSEEFPTRDRSDMDTFEAWKQENLLWLKEEYQSSLEAHAKYKNAFNQALEECDHIKVNQFLDEDKNFNSCLLKVVKNCCKYFKRKQFEDYKKNLEFLKSLLKTKKFDPQLKTFVKAIKFNLVHIVKILSEFSTVKVINLALNVAAGTRKYIKEIIEEIVELIKSGDLQSDDPDISITKAKLQLALIDQIISILYLSNSSDASIKWVLDQETPEYLEFLIDHKNIDINKTFDSVRGRFTPLEYAVFDNKIKIIKTLLQKGANPNNPTIPPLILTIKNGNYSVVHLLFDYGADLNVEWLGKDAFDYALESGNKKIIDLFLWADI